MVVKLSLTLILARTLKYAALQMDNALLLNFEVIIMYWNEELEEYFQETIEEIGIKDKDKFRALYSEAYLRGYFMRAISEGKD